MARDSVVVRAEGGPSHQIPVGEGDGICARHEGRQHGRQVLSSEAAIEVPRNNRSIQEVQLSWILPPTEISLLPIFGISQRPTWRGSRSHTEATGYSTRHKILLSYM